MLKQLADLLRKMADKIDPPAKAVEPPAGSDPDNSSFVTMESAATYGYIYTGQRGSAVAQKLIIQKPGGVVAMYGGIGAGQLAGWGNPTGGAVIANFNAGTATLSQCAQVLAQLLAHFKQRGDLAL